jgi:hypothetical protein
LADKILFYLILNFYGVANVQQKIFQVDLGPII